MALAYRHEKSLQRFLDILKKTKYQANFPSGRDMRGKYSRVVLTEIDAILKNIKGNLLDSPSFFIRYIP
jgi:hypothetical protein